MIMIAFLYKKSTHDHDVFLVQAIHRAFFEQKGLQIDIRRTMPICDKNPCRHPHSDSSVGGTPAGLAGIQQRHDASSRHPCASPGVHLEGPILHLDGRTYAVSDKRGGSGRSVKTFRKSRWGRDDRAPRFLIHERDSIYGVEFRRRIKGCLGAILPTGMAKAAAVPAARGVARTNSGKLAPSKPCSTAA
jgi:hypothetical protein